MALLRDVHPTVAEILDGKHDDILHAFRQACDHRDKAKRSESGIRAGAPIRMTAAATKIAGRTGVILKVNKKSLSIVLDCPMCGSHDEVPEDTAWDARCEECVGLPTTWNVGPALVEVVAAVQA